MGRHINTLSCFIYFNNLSFNFFTSFMPWFSLCDIDMGEINHSTHLLTNSMHFLYDVLLKRFGSLLGKTLPCTGKPSPFSILGNKGTIKHDVTQPTLRTVLLEKYTLFEKYFLSYPEVISHTGENVTELLLSSVKNVLGWSFSEIQERPVHKTKCT